MRFVILRTVLRSTVQWIADRLSITTNLDLVFIYIICTLSATNHFADFNQHSFNKFVVNASLHKQTTGSDAIFTLVEKHATHTLEVKLNKFIVWLF